MDPEKFSCIRQVVKTVKIPLWDMYTTTEHKGIEAALDKWKRQYEKQVGGIVVSYKNVSIPSRLGFHSDRGSYAMYDVRATFDLFCPKVGEIVKGKINRVSSEHIGCLIEGTINATIRLPRDCPLGLSKYIYLDHEILFEILSFSCKPRALCVEGVITPKCIELMDEFYPVAEEFRLNEPGNQDTVFGNDYQQVDLSILGATKDKEQVDLSILGTTKDKKKGKKRGRDEDGGATDSPKVKKIKTDMDLTNHVDMSSQDGDSSTADTPKKKKSPKVKKIKKDLDLTNHVEMSSQDGHTSATDTPKTKKKSSKAKKNKKDLKFTNHEEMSQDGNSSATDIPKKAKKKKASKDSPKVDKNEMKLIESLISMQEEIMSSNDSPKKLKKSSSKGSPKVSLETNSNSTKAGKKRKHSSSSSSHDSDSSSTESTKKELRDIFSTIKSKKKTSKPTDSPKKIKKEQSSTEDENSKKKSKKKQKKKSKDSSKSKDKKKDKSKKKGKITASGDVLKKDKKKSKKDSKSKSSKKSKKNNKKDKSEKKKSKKIKLSNDSDADVLLKEIKSEGN